MDDLQAIDRRLAFYEHILEGCDDHSNVVRHSNLYTVYVDKNSLSPNAIPENVTNYALKSPLPQFDIGQSKTFKVLPSAEVRATHMEQFYDSLRSLNQPFIFEIRSDSGPSAIHLSFNE
ncbi:MAG: hypothetical protein M3362_10155, partial [Acidobacteriota bacterium]|nr:hypothetical protein [Acidobacteriota bacterium]